MNLLITGGTGFLGKEICNQLQTNKMFNKVVIYSRDEHKQKEMAETYPDTGPDGCRYFIGDVRNKTRLLYAMKNVDFVIHAAALKHVDTAEYNPQECIETNIIGSKNVIEACIESGVQRCIVISSDKAVHPINLYGTTKLCMEKLAIASNNLGKCKFSAVRYGNVSGSTGSVIPIWKQHLLDQKPAIITNKNMTRFWISIKDAANFVLSKFHIMEGGEIYIPKLKSKSMGALFDEIYKEIYKNDMTYYKIKETGIRPGEKIHETLISKEDARNCYDNDDFFIIYPSHHAWRNEFNKKGQKVPDNFTYSSERI